MVNETEPPTRGLFAMTAVFAVNSEPSVGVGAAELPNIDVNKFKFAFYRKPKSSLSVVLATALREQDTR